MIKIKSLRIQIIVLTYLISFFNYSVLFCVIKCTSILSQKKVCFSDLFHQHILSIKKNYENLNGNFIDSSKSCLNTCKAKLNYKSVAADWPSSPLIALIYLLYLSDILTYLSAAALSLVYLAWQRCQSLNFFFVYALGKEESRVNLRHKKNYQVFVIFQLICRFCHLLTRRRLPLKCFLFSFGIINAICHHVAEKENEVGRVKRVWGYY